LVAKQPSQKAHVTADKRMGSKKKAGAETKIAEKPKLERVK
jgi:hypothetical protein